MCKAAFFVPGGQVSGLHARIERAGEHLVLIDAGSTSGSYVNGARVERRALRPGEDDVRDKPAELATPHTLIRLALDHDRLFTF